MKCLLKVLFGFIKKPRQCHRQKGDLKELTHLVESILLLDTLDLLALHLRNVCNQEIVIWGKGTTLPNAHFHKDFFYQCRIHQNICSNILKLEVDVHCIQFAENPMAFIISWKNCNFIKSQVFSKSINNIMRS